MDLNRKLWNDGQQKLRRALASKYHTQVIEYFLTQHAMVHTKKINRSDLWSFEDEIWQGSTTETIRAVPPKSEHSIAWILFHIARIEDITMNMLVAGTPQLYTRDKWAGKLNSTIHHSANKMDNESVVNLSFALDIDILRDYRFAVGCRTREIVKQIQPEDLPKKVDSACLQKVVDEGAVTREAIEIVNYWGKRTIAGLLLMPPTRHNFLHLNEAFRIKQKLSL